MTRNGIDRTESFEKGTHDPHDGRHFCRFQGRQADERQRREMGNTKCNYFSFNCLVTLRYTSWQSYFDISHDRAPRLIFITLLPYWQRVQIGKTTIQITSKQQQQKKKARDQPTSGAEKMELSGPGDRDTALFISCVSGKEETVSSWRLGHLQKHPSSYERKKGNEN